VVSGGKPAALLYGVQWEEVHLPEQVRHTLYQVPAATALVEAIYEGAMQVSTLRNHGGLGLGTFGGPDGEMVIVDGHSFQVRGDGSVREVRDNVLSPFAAVTATSADQAMCLDYCPDLSHLTSQLTRSASASMPCGCGLTWHVGGARTHRIEHVGRFAGAKHVLNKDAGRCRDSAASALSDLASMIGQPKK